MRRVRGLFSLSLRSRLLQRYAFLNKQLTQTRTTQTNNYVGNVRESSGYIDLRSDTVTLPSEDMKKAMVSASLGDDVYGEDSTVNALEKRCATLFGKEAGIFVASGTMGNLLAVMVQCGRGDEIIVGRYNHIHRWEQGNYASIAGVSATTLNNLPDGSLGIPDIVDSIRVKDSHMPRTRLICLETTHNYCGGKPLSMEYLKSVRELANDRKLLVHIDGARIFNAAVALNVKVSDIAALADSVMMCFSKGLGAPVGSILVGSKDFIDDARRKRKALGGGWRQAGVLAAAAMVSLDNADQTITRDHEHARRLAMGINHKTPDHLKQKIFAVEENITNMVIVHCKNGVSNVKLMEFFKSHNVLIMVMDESRLRIVLNWNVNSDGVDRVLELYEMFTKSLITH